MLNIQCMLWIYLTNIRPKNVITMYTSNDIQIMRTFMTIDNEQPPISSLSLTHQQRSMGILDLYLHSINFQDHLTHQTVIHYRQSLNYNLSQPSH